MKKYLVILCVVLCSLMTAGVTLASPLTDYSAGKVALDVNWTPNTKLEGSTAFGSESFDGKNGNFDFGLTAGLGNKWAIQYRYANPVSKDFASYHVGLRSQEVNLLYQLNNNLSAFIGWHQAKISTNFPVAADNRNSWQIGLIGTTEIAKKTSLYGIVGAGSGLFSAEAGVAYAFDKSLDLNLFYRYKRVDSLKVYSEEIDTTAKGFGLGITYKF